MSEQLALLPGYLAAHLQLVLLALGVGTSVSVPLGIAIHRQPRWEPGVLGVASVIQTIPSLALLAVMVPLFAGLGAALAGTGLEIRGIGFLPAAVALTLYSLLPILRNTVTGLAGVDPDVREAARGVGMTASQQLWQVELPLALPVIVAGLRTAAVWVVGTATLSTPIGATSLGNYIFSGLATRNDAAIWLGCIAAAGLALVLDLAIRWIERGARERRRGFVLAGAAGLLALVGFVLAHGALGDASERPLRIGSKSFTEQYILAEVLAQELAATGVDTEAVPSLGSTVAFDALASGDLDVYVDYSGTLWATILKRETGAASRAEVLREVTDYLANEHGIGVAAALGFENTYALAMRRADAEALGLSQLSALSRHTPRLSIGGDYEFFARAEWRDLVTRYGFAFEEERSMDPALMYDAVAAGEVDVISAFSTDGRIAALDLAVLADDRGVIPPYDALVLVGARLQREHPEALARLEALAGRIDAATMQRLNHAVDADGRAPGEVARAFLAGAF
ncbi:MAG: ABC transporter permease/substrate-binding protein [Myxococcota bacterium]